MHSSRMRTTRSLTVSHSICQGACMPCMPPAMHIPTMHTPCHTCPPPCTPPAMHTPFNTHAPRHAPPPPSSEKGRRGCTERVVKDFSKFPNKKKAQKPVFWSYLVIPSKHYSEIFAPSYNFFYVRNLKEEKKF